MRDLALSYAVTRCRCTFRNTIASGAAVAKATSANTQSYANITPATITINVPSSSHASAPHEKNCDSVSTSLVTRATSAPFRSSL